MVPVCTSPPLFSGRVKQAQKDESALCHGTLWACVTWTAVGTQCSQRVAYIRQREQGHHVSCCDRLVSHASQIIIPACPNQNSKRRVPLSAWDPFKSILHHSLVSKGVLIGGQSPEMNCDPDRCYITSGWLVLWAAKRSGLFCFFGFAGFWVEWYVGTGQLLAFRDKTMRNYETATCVNVRLYLLFHAESKVHLKLLSTLIL